MFMSLYRTLARTPLALSQKAIQISSRRQHFKFIQFWFARVSNLVDTDRIKQLGPDYVCAEWVLKNGAEVRLKGETSFINDYNLLLTLEETMEPSLFKVEEIVAKEATVSGTGFLHLKDCKGIKKMRFIYCRYLDDKALELFKHVSDSLEFLEIKSCYSVTDVGVKSLTELRNLRELILRDLASLNKKDECETALRKALTNCKIEFTS